MVHLTRSLTLLLTATIQPGKTTFVARNDPLVRMEDYRAALRSWLSVGVVKRIVFCENSGYDLAQLVDDSKLFPECVVEFISLYGNECGETRGKGFAEIALIDHALRTSRFLMASEVIVKCTGRLSVRNAAKLVSRLTADSYDVMCTLRRCLTFADSRLFAATPTFLEKHLLPQQIRIDDARGVYFEHALARAVSQSLVDDMKWRPFPIFPVIDGVSGTYGNSMNHSWIGALARDALHRFRVYVDER